MDWKSTLAKSALFVLLPLFLQVSMAGSKPLYTIAAIQQAPTSIASNQSAVASYRVTNNTKTDKTLVIKAIAGVTVVTTTSDACSWPIELGPGASCILNLTINGPDIPGSIIGGPVVCKVVPNTTQVNNGACSQPSNAESFRITKAPAADLTQNGWIGVVIAQSEPPADIETYVNNIYSFAPMADEVHIRVSPILNPTADPSSNPKYQYFANVIAALKAKYAANPNFQVGYHVDASKGSAQYWGCASGDWHCVLTDTIVVLNNINALADPGKQGKGFTIYSIEQSYIIPVDPPTINNVKACLNPATSGTCPVSVTASPTQLYGDVLPSYGSSDIYGPNYLDRGYVQTYNLLKELSAADGNVLVTSAADSFFPPDSAANCISGSYPYNVIDANLTGGPIPLNPPRLPLIPCFDSNTPSTPYPNPANDVFTYNNMADPALAAAYDAYLMSQLPPISVQINTNGAIVYITFSGEPEFFGSTGWTYSKMTSFYDTLNSNFTRLNTLIPGIIPPTADVSAIKYGIWNFDQILENNN